MTEARTCQQCGTPLSSDAVTGLCPVCVLGGALRPTQDSEPRFPDPNESAEFGDYELIEEIARGGMGVVYKARQKSLDRIVALKMLLFGQHASPDVIRRFRVEAVAAGSLQHPNIVAIHEVGIHNGQHFLVMDYVDGPNLAKFARGQPLSPKRAAEYVKTIAEAIEYAHSRGILHRDLKPSNVLIDSNDEPRVTDFGLARRIEGDSSITLTGQVVGSPNYMPPEQAAGCCKFGRVGRASDVYGLGAILYYLLTGRPPIQGDTIPDTLHQVVNVEPVSPRLLNPAAPFDLQTICLKCLQKESERRYATARELADELQRFLKDEPIHSRPVTRTEKAWLWCRRKPALAGALAMSVLAIGFAAFFGAQAHRAELRRHNERRQNAIDKALMTAWTGDLDGAEQAIRDAELAGVSVADLRMLRGSVAMHRGDYREAVQHLEQAWKLSPKSVAVCCMLINAYSLTGNWDKTESMYGTLDGLVPTTPEDFLFRSSVDVLVDPVKALQTLNEAIRRRPSGIALLHRGSVRAGVAQEAGRIDDAEAAIADINAAKALLPPNAQAIAQSLKAHLIAAEIYDEHHLTEKRAAAWRQVESDAASLQQFDANQASILARAIYLKHLGDDPAPLRQLRASVTNGVTDYFLALTLYRHSEFQAALEILQPAQKTGLGADYMRGYFLAELPNGPELALKEFYRLWHANPSTWDALAIQTTLRLLGRKNEAMNICRKAREKASFMPWRKEWYRQLLDYNCGDISETDLLKGAGASRYNQSEAHFFIGLTRLADGDRNGARDHFRASVATRVFHYFDYDWSGAFLARMEKDPSWPPWIPLRNQTL